MSYLGNIRGRRSCRYSRRQPRNPPPNKPLPERQKDRQRVENSLLRDEYQLNKLIVEILVTIVLTLYIVSEAKEGDDHVSAGDT